MVNNYHNKIPWYLGKNQSMVSPWYHAQTARLYHSAFSFFFFFIWNVFVLTPINNVRVYKCVCDCKPCIYFFSIFLVCLSHSVLLIVLLVLVIQLDNLTQAPLSWARLAADTHVTKPNIWLWLSRTLSDSWHTLGQRYTSAQTNIK